MEEVEVIKKKIKLDFDSQKIRQIIVEEYKK